MPVFEILIPKTPKIPMDMRLRVEAESWIDALKMGRKKVGESSAVTDNVLVDIRDDNSIHVTDAGTGRVFRIIEITEGAPSEAAPELPASPAAEPPAPRPAPVEPPAAPPAVEPPPPPAPAPVQPPAAPPEPRAKAAEPVPPPKRPKPAEPEKAIGREINLTSESTADFLEEIFEKTQDVNAKDGRDEALYFMLDLAMDRVGTDSGSILLADINKYYLEFVAVRGPKSQEVMKFQVAMGQGIVGFCAEEAVGVAVSDVTKDPRFYSTISEKIGYPTRSILCVPVQLEGRVFGALELINRKDSDIFSERDLGVANFIASQLAQYLERLES